MTVFQGLQRLFLLRLAILPLAQMDKDRYANQGNQRSQPGRAKNVIGNSKLQIAHEPRIIWVYLPGEIVLMLIKIVIVVTLMVIVGSLFSALFYLMKDKGTSTRTARALTVRISLSLILFALLMLGYYFGLIGQPHP